MFRYQNRTQAGRYLAEKLTQYAGASDAVVLGLPRGGVVVAHEIARALELPLDLFLVRKLGVPGYEELAMGAIASGGIRVMNEEVMRQIRIPEAAVDAVARREAVELKRREAAYRGDLPPFNVEGLTVVLVDDGLATGSTMRAAVKALRGQGPKQIIVAVPTAAPDVCDEFRAEVDDIVCGMTPTPFYAVGAWYEDFSQTTDEEVRQLLRTSRRVSMEDGEKRRAL